MADRHYRNMRAWAMKNFPYSFEHFERGFNGHAHVGFTDFHPADASVNNHCELVLDIGRVPKTPYANLTEILSVNFFHYEKDPDTLKYTFAPLPLYELDSRFVRDALNTAYRIVFAADKNRKLARLLRSVIAFRFLASGYLAEFPSTPNIKSKSFK